MPPIPRISASVPPAVARQVAASRAAMSPQTLAVLTPRTMARSLLDAPIVEGLDNQLRVRVDGAGQPSQRRYVADNALTAKFMQSDAWPNLERMLRVASSGADWAPGKTTLKGFVLPRDLQSVAASEVLSVLDTTGKDTREFERALRRSTSAGPALHSLGAQVKSQAVYAGAWNADGWITFLPDVARGMLIAAGAYHPAKFEKALRRAGVLSDYLSGNAAHEVQHSVTKPGNAYVDRLAWMEEGTANLFSRTWPVLQQHQRAAGTTEQSFASRLGKQPSFDLHWRGFKRPQPSARRKQHDDKQTQTRYVDSLSTLKHLARLAGADSFQTVAGREQARELLQGRSLRYVPGVLADAIIDEHGLDPAVRERLRERIVTANSDTGGVAAIERDFLGG